MGEGGRVEKGGGDYVDMESGDQTLVNPGALASWPIDFCFLFFVFY